MIENGKKFYTSVEKYGNSILWRGYENGLRFSRKVKFKPSLFVPTKDEEVDFHSLMGYKPIKEKSFESMSDAKDFIERYDGVSGFDMYGNSNFIAQFIQEKYPNEIEFDMNHINIVSFDIEVDVSEKFPDMEICDNEITSISIKSSKTDTYHLLALKDYDKTKTISGVDPDHIQFMKFDNEKDMLKRFVEIWKYDYPDIVTGWNVEYFDIWYIIMRIIRLLGESKAKELSPWGLAPRKKTAKIFHRDQSTFVISGVAVIDYMAAFKKFGYKYGKQESYKLDHIAHVVLGEKKIDYSEYGSLTELYRQNPQLYLDYSLKDTVLIQRMEDESALLSLVLTVAYSGGVNYNDAFGTVGIWESILFRKLINENIVPQVKSGSGGELGDLVGGYVKEPIIGMKKWTVSFDLDSLYPHLMMQYNMSPETLIRDNVENVTGDMVLRGEYKNMYPEMFSVAANGVCFSNKKLGMIPSIITELYDYRKKVKQEMLKCEQQEQDEKDPVKRKAIKKQITQLHNRQMSVKILMNSLYGALANRYFLYYVKEIAEAITTSGQLSVRYGAMSINNYMNKALKTDGVDYIEYIDTDSNYVNMCPLMEKVFGTVDVDPKKGEAFLSKVCVEKIQPVLEKGYNELANDMGAYRNAMSMKLEKITNTTIFLGKKRYLMNTLSSEGVHYDIPKISMTGVEAIRSTTPEVCRNVMKDLIRVVLNGTEEDTQKLIAEFKEKFYKMSAEQISKTSGTDDIDKFVDGDGYAKGCPIHVRGAILYNEYIKRVGIDNIYESIKSGDKVKFVYLKLPNPIRENVVSFPSYLPPELNLNDYIDYDVQFEKVFLNPMTTILETIGWSHEKINNLEDFFS
jgi:DNA polymerase elongation subunit (family B)